MSESNEKILETVLSKALEVAQSTGDFMQEQIPDVAQQLLMFKLAQYTFYTALFFLLLVGCAFLWKRWWKYAKDTYNDYETHLVPLCFILAVVTLPLAVAFCVHASTTLMIWLAPKVYLIEYAASLVK